MGIAVMLGLTATAVLRGPLGKALARRLEGPPALPDTSAQQLDDLQVRMADLEVQVGRMHELEERLDFAERLLAQGREPVQLPVPRERM
jgi:hypothetical protein